MKCNFHIDPTDPRFVVINGRRLARVMGAETDGGDGGEGGEGGGEGGSTEGGEGGEGGDQQQRQSQKRQSSEGGSDDDDEKDKDKKKGGKQERPITDEERSELNRLRREVAKEASERKKAERKKAQEEGRFHDIVADAERERDEAIAAKEEAEFTLEQYKRKQVVTGVATRLNFHDPEMVFDLLEEDDTEDEQVIEHALKQLASKKPFLVNTGRRSGAPGTGTNGGKEQTPEQGLRSAMREVATSRRIGED